MQDLRMAARAMARHGLAHAYGHVSVRTGADRFLTSPAKPLGLVKAADEGVEVHLDRPLPPGALPEVRIHREIYRRRPGVGGIVRVQPPAVMALSALRRTPRALHGLGSYFAPQPPLWPGVELVRDDRTAAGVAGQLGEARAIVLAGNGCVCVGDTVRHAAAHAFFLEDAARLELALLAASEPPIEYSADEASRRAVGTGGLYERMWDFLCFGDEEWRPSS
jgi:HCOMODA/2-hydroxy-3-carboxy-muconic semialdehyde decarboxylase